MHAMLRDSILSMMVALVILLVCVVHPTEGGQIAATFSTSSKLSLSVLDPKSGSIQNQLFATSSDTQPFPISPAVDHDDRTTYIPVSNSSSSSISILGLAIADDFESAGVVQQFVSPFVSISALGFYGDGVLLAIGQESAGQSFSTFWLILVGTPFQFSVHVPLLPATNFTAGGFDTVGSAFYNGTRAFIFPTYNPSTAAFGLAFLNIDNNQYAVAPQNDFLPIALAHDPFSDIIYAVIAPVSSAVGQVLGFGTIDPRSFAINILQLWPDKYSNFATVVGGMATLGDSMYVVLADREGNNPNIVTVSLTSGLPTQVTPLPAGVNPLSLAWLP